MQLFVQLFDKKIKMESNRVVKILVTGLGAPFCVSEIEVCYELSGDGFQVYLSFDSIIALTGAPVQIRDRFVENHGIRLPGCDDDFIELGLFERLLKHRIPLSKNVWTSKKVIKDAFKVFLRACESIESIKKS